MVEDCDVGIGDILGSKSLGSGCGPEDGLRYSYLAGIGVIALLLLAVLGLLLAVCCLGFRVCKHRSGSSEVSDLLSLTNREGNIVAESTQVKSTPAPPVTPAPSEPKDPVKANDYVAVKLEADDTEMMYDSIEDMQLIPLKKSQEELPLPGYDTVSFEKVENLVSDPPTASSSNKAPPSCTGASEEAQYSVVMKKTVPSEKSANDRDAEKYDVLSHSRQAVVTYSSLNQPLKSASGNSEDIYSDEAPPPPIPPPISENNLLAMGEMITIVQPPEISHDDGNANGTHTAASASNPSKIEQKENSLVIASQSDTVAGEN